MKEHTDKELIDFLTSLKTGAVTLISDDEPQRVYVGNVYYQSSNGWQVAVNIDCNNFEHFIVFVSGDRITDFDGMPVYIHSYFRKSSSDEIYRIFGIPGYMIVRSDRWMGYNHTPIKGLRYYWEDIKAKVNLWKFRRNQI